MQAILQEYGETLATKGLRIILILVCTYAAYRLCEFIVARVGGVPMGHLGGKRRRRGETLLSIIQHVLFATFCFFGLMSLLRELDIDTTSLLAGVSIIGLSVGVGAQSLVKDFVAGFFILVENQYAIGDIIRIKGLTGKVLELTLRTTKLEGSDHVIHTVPNGLIDTVTNYSKETYFGAVRICVSQDYDPEKVMKILNDSLAAVSGLKELKPGAAVSGLSSMDKDSFFYDVKLPSAWVDSCTVCAAYQYEVAKRLYTAGIVLRSIRIGGPELVKENGMSA